MVAKRLFCLPIIGMLAFLATSPGVRAEPLYKADFEDIEVGEVPDDFLVLEGEFEVKEADGNKVLELPGTPVSSFSAILGPAETEDVEVSVRVQCENTKRRYSVFGVGLSGISGYRLQVNPTKRALELYRLNEEVATQAFKWESGKWTHLKLRTEKKGEGAWTVRGRAWTEGAEEPSEWQVSFEDKEEPLTGKPSIWATPYAEKPISFDDVVVEKTGN